MGPKVSIIIPVYNVEKYIRQCIESVTGQIYSNLEILMTDDGSTDNSGRICDEYAASDHRITVFHTENKGLSAARNNGLDHCTGDYIWFLDSDDWLEETAIEDMMTAITSVRAEIAVCAHFNEWKDGCSAEYIQEQPQVSEGDSIMREYLHGGGINVQVWNKLYRSDLFRQIRFPVGRIHEDIATTYKLIDAAEKLIRLNKPLVHYRLRSSSLGKAKTIKELTDLWTSCYERYNALIDRFEDCQVGLLSACLNSIGRYWIWYYGCPEKESGKNTIREMKAFAREHRHEVRKDPRYPRSVRFSCFVSRFSGRFIFRTLYYMNQNYRRNRTIKMFD